MTDQECLVCALVDMGFNQQMIEVHALAVPLVGYAGDQRALTANIVIRRQHIGPSSNDLGFVSTNTGYHAVVSNYDTSQFGTAWISRLCARYDVHWNAKKDRLEAAELRRVEEERKRIVEAQRTAIHERAKKMGYSVVEKREGESLRLVLVKRTY